MLLYVNSRVCCRRIWIPGNVFLMLLNAYLCLSISRICNLLKKYCKSRPLNWQYNKFHSDLQAKLSRPCKLELFVFVCDKNDVFPSQILNISQQFLTTGNCHSSFAVINKEGADKIVNGNPNMSAIWLNEI